MNIELTEKQFHILSNAMEFYNRFCIGQISVPMELRFKDLVDYPEINEWENNWKRILFPEFTSPYWQSYGYDKYPEQYEIWREMTHQWTLHKWIDNVYTSTTLHTSKEPLIKVTF